MPHAQAPSACLECDFLADAGRCRLLAEPTAQNLDQLLREGNCEPRSYLRGALRQSWPWLSPSAAEDLAADGASELVILAAEKSQEQIVATFGERVPNAYLFTQVEPPSGWAYRNLLRRHLRRHVRQRQREVPEGPVSTHRPEGVVEPALGGSTERLAALPRLRELDRRSALLIDELLRDGDVDRDLWAQLLAIEHAFMPHDLDGVRDALRLKLGRVADRDLDASRQQLAKRLPDATPRAPAAVTNALTLARYKFTMVVTGVLDVLSEARLDAIARLDVRALVARHFTAQVVTEAQAYAAVKARGEDRGAWSSKQGWRATYQRGAERSLDALLEQPGWGPAVQESLVGFRRVLGLPDVRRTP